MFLKSICWNQLLYPEQYLIPRIWAGFPIMHECDRSYPQFELEHNRWHEQPLQYIQRCVVYVLRELMKGAGSCDPRTDPALFIESQIAGPGPSHGTPLRG